jgi:hypothetical protein
MTPKKKWVSRLRLDDHPAITTAITNSGWCFGTCFLMTFPSYWEWNNHPNCRASSFFRGVAKNHQPELFLATCHMVDMLIVS